VPTAWPRTGHGLGFAPGPLSPRRLIDYRHFEMRLTWSHRIPPVEHAASSQVRPAHLASASTSLRWRNATDPASSRKSRARRHGSAPQR